MGTTLLVGLVLLGGCKATEGAACAKNEDCASGLTCHDYKCATIEQMKRLREERARRRADRQHCSAQYMRGFPNVRENTCLDNGWCSRAPNGECVAGRDEDCKESRKCSQTGKCRLVNARTYLTCGSGTTADCVGSTECSIKGKCALIEHIQNGHVSCGQPLTPESRKRWRTISVNPNLVNPPSNASNSAEAP